MLIHVPAVLSPNDLIVLKQQLEGMQWQRGSDCAGALAKMVKHNVQLSSQDPQFSQVAQLVAARIAAHPLIQAAAIPEHVVAPIFNCYQDGAHYGQHVDNARMTDILNGQNYRADLSLTLFLSNPDEYEGGELIIEDAYAEHEVKLDAGDAILYLSGNVHRVLPVTQGCRLAACTWLQSRVPRGEHRQILFDLDRSITELRQTDVPMPQLLKLVQIYHNLLRSLGA